MPTKVIRTSPINNDKYKSMLDKNLNQESNQNINFTSEKSNITSEQNIEVDSTKNFNVSDKKPTKPKREKKSRTFMMYQDTYKILQYLKMNDEEEREIYQIIDEAILLYNNSKKS